MAAEPAGAADRVLAPGVTTWPSLSALQGDVLGIINSPAGDEQTAANMFDAIERCVPPDRLHVIVGTRDAIIAELRAQQAREVAKLERDLGFATRGWRH